MKRVTHNRTQTLAVAKQLARRLRGGEVLALSGELGAGKTTFVQGLAQGLGIRHTVTSPTFLLMRVYPIRKKGAAIKQLVHIDCYRIKSPQAIKAIGALEYFGKSATVVAIEWPEKIKGLLPRQAVKILLRLGKQDTHREIIT